jgi:hypothetical protein
LPTDRLSGRCKGSRKEVFWYLLSIIQEALDVTMLRAEDVQALDNDKREKKKKKKDGRY